MISNASAHRIWPACVSRSNARKSGRMVLHLVKLCAGAGCVGDQQDWVTRRVAQNKKAGRGAVHDCVTRMRPKRTDELLDGGSLYWVIKGVIQVRQQILGFEPRTGRDGVSRTAIMLSPKLVETRASRRRAFQGWRYLAPGDAPADLKAGAHTPPAELSAALAELGLL